MSRVLIRRALEKRLNALSPVLPTKWENAAFTVTAGTAWQSAKLMLADTRAMAVFSDSPEEWNGYLHLLLHYPAGTGSAAVEARITALIGDRITGAQGHFYRGLALTEGGANLTIYQPVAKSADEDDPQWYSVPVHIPFLLHTN